MNTGKDSSSELDPDQIIDSNTGISEIQKEPDESKMMIGNTDFDSDEAIIGDTEPKREIFEAIKALGIGLLIGVLVAGVGFVRKESAQSGFSSLLARVDSCGSASTTPSGFCLNAPASVALIANNPASELLGNNSEAIISSGKASIGKYKDAALQLTLSKITGQPLGGSTNLAGVRAGEIVGTLSLPYKELSATLQANSNSGASIFYAGQGKIGTSNNISYQGKEIPLVVISKIELKNGQLLLTPETVNALGRTAPASAVFSNISPVPIVIPTLPKGMSYKSLGMTKQALVFHMTGTSVTLNNLFKVD